MLRVSSRFSTVWYHPLGTNMVSPASYKHCNAVRLICQDLAACCRKEKEKERKDYAFWHQFNEKLCLTGLPRLLHTMTGCIQSW